MTMLITCGKFHNRLPQLQSSCGSKRVRLGSISPSKTPDIYENVEPVVVDEDCIMLSDGREIEWERFIEQIYDKKTRYITLKNEPISKIWHIIEFYRIKNIDSIENITGIIESSPSSPLSTEGKNAEISEIKRRLRIMEEDFNVSMKKHRTFIGGVAERSRYYIERKLRSKCRYDSKFFFAYRHGYAEVFRAVENRKDRKVYALDFNSMYPSAMLYANFSNPKTLRYIHGGEETARRVLNGEYEGGIFNVRLKPCDKRNFPFLRDFHYLRYVYDNFSLPFSMDYNDVIETTLHANEIRYFSKFCSIEIIDGIASSECIQHPMSDIVLKLYSKRLITKDEFKKNMLKKILASLHGSTNPLLAKRTTCESVEEMQRFFDGKYYMPIPEEEDSRYFNTRVSKKGDKYIVQAPDIDDNRHLYCMSSQIIANARLALIRTMELFVSKIPEIEICYVNLDSIHLSLPKDKDAQFLELLDNEALKGIGIGQIKIEAEGDNGIWLDVGKYWIRKGSEVIKYRGTFGGPYINRKQFISKQHKIYHTQKWLFMLSSLTYYKKLSPDAMTYERYHISLINEHLPNIYNLLLDEISSSANKKKAIYYDMLSPKT